MRRRAGGDDQSRSARRNRGTPSRRVRDVGFCRAARRSHPQRRRCAHRDPARDRISRSQRTRGAVGRVRRGRHDLRLGVGRRVRSDRPTPPSTPSRLPARTRNRGSDRIRRQRARGESPSPGRARLDSPALVADGQHARVDGFVSLGVIASAGAVALGIKLADPLIGLAITVLILRITWQAWQTVSADHDDHSHP